jgi:Skp family chaperone for outer membrane proteins
LLYTQKLINLNNKISNLNEKLNNLNYQILKNIEPYIEEIAKLYDVDFVFINYISYNKNNVVNLTDALIQKIKKHK